jgi:hypothetical protein
MSAVRGFFSGVFGFLLFDAFVLLGIIISLNLTILNPDFVTAELEKFDVYSAVIEQAKTRLPDQQFISTETVDELVSELKPWFEEQSNTVIHAVYAYIEEDHELNVTISLEPVRAAVKENVRESVINSLPPELQGASQSQIDAYMSQIYTGIDNVIPSSFVLNEGVAGSQIMTQLEQVKKIVGYIDTAYKALIAAAVLLVLLIALVYWWQPKPITRSIGITFTLVGVACILGPLLDYLIVQVLNQFIGTSGLTSGIQAKLPQLVADLTVPVRMYGIGFLGSGVVLVAISFLFRSPESRPDAIKTY